MAIEEVKYMSCCKCDCAYIAVIVGIIFGVILGVLYALGFVATGIIFWLYLLIGVAGIFLIPIYGFLSSSGNGFLCFCSYKALLLIASAGAVIAGFVGLIVSAVASTVVVAIVLSVATFFAAMLLTALICLSRCICRQ